MLNQNDPYSLGPYTLVERQIIKYVYVQVIYFISPLLEVFSKYKENNKRQDPALSVKRSRTNMNKINILIQMMMCNKSCNQLGQGHLSTMRELIWLKRWFQATE